MPDNTPAGPPRPVREIADSYVTALAEINPFVATRLGVRPDEDRMPDLSPAGQAAVDDLRRSTLAALDALPPEVQAAGDDERRCARLLRERLGAALAMSEAGEHLREVSNIFGPLQRVRDIFTLMPADTDSDWAVVARRMGAVPAALAGYRESLALGAERGLFAAPRQVSTVAGQLGQWLEAGAGTGWYAEFAAGADVPAALRADLDTAAAGAAAAVAQLRDWMTADYLPRAAGTPDGMGEERYLRSARVWTGAELDLAEIGDWGWSEYHRIRAEMQEEAGRVLPGAAPAEAMRYLDEHSAAVDGAEQARVRLQQMMDDAISSLDGTHFDIAGPIRTVQAMIAPAGSAAAPYYSPPSQDFSRPGRTWLPTLGRTRFPEWSLISVWYHEGVPGHHLQLAQWVHLAGRLSRFQTGVGGVSACSEGWALYAERLMDELGYLKPPGARLGYLDAQMMRAVRIVVDLGMHLGLTVPG
ncbi:MAG TPA: DUF885 domain-containing protein, partial [Streptosporangiaceae bacterium]|nr:DUF885 domain-containing protein [Streptosporangiaceae bacterium]